jgi:protoporphyrinogen oxidase
VLKSSLGIETEGYAHQLNFHYPRIGGIQAVIEGLTRNFPDKIVRDFEVKSIYKADGKWAVSDGRRTRRYDAVVSTIPLPTLAEAANLPDPARKAARDLKVNSVICVCLGGVRLRRTDLSWLYVPTKTALMHRVSFLSNFSDMSTPPGRHSFVADITCKFNDNTWRMSDDALVQRTVQDLLSEGVLDSGQFDAALVARQKYAYVIDDMDRQNNVKVLREHLDKIGLLTCGRFAEFEYLNMDGIVIHALDFVKKYETVLQRAV